MAEWPSDQDVLTAAYRLSGRLQELLDAGYFPTPVGPNTREIITGTIEADAQEFIAVDPQKLVDQYDMLQRAAAQVDGEKAHEYTDNIRRAVEDWNGEAAEAFKTHIGHFDPFHESQHGFLQETRKSLIAAYKLAVLSRRDFVDLADATSAAIDRHLSDAADRETSTTLKIAGGVVAGVLSAATGGVVGVGLAVGAAAITGAIEAHTAELSAPEPLDIVTAYRDEHTRIRDALQQDYNALATFNDTQRSDVDGLSTGLFTPLPSYTDVDSPDFSYDKFFSEWESSPGFGERVDENRAAPPPANVRRDSPISLALG